MSTTLAHSGLPPGVNRFDLLRLFEQAARPGYALSSTAVALIRQYILKTLDADFEPGRICAVWTQACRFAELLGLTPRTINSAERELEQARFIVRTAGINGERTGDRKDGVIAWAAGINLAPLIERFVEIQAKVETLKLEASAIGRCRAEIRQIGKRIRELGDDGLRGRAEGILPGGRTARIGSLGRLTAIREALAAILSAIEEAPRASKNSDAPEESCAPESQNHKSPRKRTAQLTRGTVSPAMAVTVATEEYRSLVEVLGGATWQNLVETSWRSCGRLGISQQTWGSACHQLGRERAALCVLLIDRNASRPLGDRYRARWPARCLSGMARRVRVHDLNFVGMFCACQRADAPGKVCEPDADAAVRLDQDRTPLAALAQGLVESLKAKISWAEDMPSSR